MSEVTFIDEIEEKIGMLLGKSAGEWISVAAMLKEVETGDLWPEVRRKNSQVRLWPQARKDQSEGSRAPVVPRPMRCYTGRISINSGEEKLRGFSPIFFGATWQFILTKSSFTALAFIAVA